MPIIQMTKSRSESQEKCTQQQGIPDQTIAWEFCLEKDLT